MTQALEVRDLAKSYGDFRLDGISFDLPMGQVMGFVGRNGAGKTTTIRLILNMARRAGGQVRVFGLDSLSHELALRQEVGVVFDEIFFVDIWKVRQVEQAIAGFYQHWDSRLFKDYLYRFGLHPDKPVKDLSRGMKMKLMLAAALSHQARLLILDEPTSGLDPVARDELCDILEDYVTPGDRSVFFSTHVTSDLERIADYLTVIERGRLFYSGSKVGLEGHFRIVKGQPSDLTSELTQEMIGLTVNRSGFRGMLPAAVASMLPAGLSIEQPTIDEVLISISKGAPRHEASF